MLRFSRLACVASLALLLASTSACGASADNEVVVDALTLATEQIYAAIDKDGTWLISVDEGSEVKGSLESAGGGSLKAAGWRTGGSHSTDTNYHLGFSERLVLDFTNYLVADSGVSLSGRVVMTRHSLDIGPMGGNTISDANRTTVYAGTVTASGAASGSFAVDVHGQAAGTLVWTCGTVNDEGFGVGACY